MRLFHVVNVALWVDKPSAAIFSGGTLESEYKNIEIHYNHKSFSQMLVHIDTVFEVRLSEHILFGYNYYAIVNYSRDAKVREQLGVRFCSA